MKVLIILLIVNFSIFSLGCKDRYSIKYCKESKRRGKCTSRYMHIIRKDCRKTCGKCNVLPQSWQQKKLIHDSNESKSRCK